MLPGSPPLHAFDLRDIGLSDRPTNLVIYHGTPLCRLGSGETLVARPRTPGEGLQYDWYRTTRYSLDAHGEVTDLGPSAEMIAAKDWEGTR